MDRSAGAYRRGEYVPKEGLPYRHGIHEAVSVLAGQWVTAVLASLNAKPMTYLELLDHINASEERAGLLTHRRRLSRKVLTETLQRMQSHGLVIKIERVSRFGNTWYQLTDTGRSLLRALVPLAKWAENSRSARESARAAHATERPNDDVAVD